MTIVLLTNSGQISLRTRKNYVFFDIWNILEYEYNHIEEISRFPDKG